MNSVSNTCFNVISSCANYVTHTKEAGTSILQSIVKRIVGIAGLILLTIPLFIVGGLAWLATKVINCISSPRGPKLTEVDAEPTLNELLINGEELHFNWEDISKLAQCNFGLRHVSSKEIWEKETNNGFPDGCSLSLMPHRSQLAQEHQWSQICVRYRDEMIKSFENGVDQFIRSSLIYDLRFTGAFIELNKTSISEVVPLINICFFSIVKYNSFSLPCDLNSWGSGLGRHYKQAIRGHQIVPIQPIKIQDLGYTKKNLRQVIRTEVQGNNLYKRMVACYRSMLIKTLREISDLNTHAVC